jgi:CheY-like chemotaxis protein
VALTANVTEGQEALSLAAGMNGHVAKPVTLAGLGALLRRWAPPNGGATQGAQAAPFEMTSPAQPVW